MSTTDTDPRTALTYGQLFSIVKTLKLQKPNDHGRVSALTQPLPGDGDLQGVWNVVFDGRAKNSQWYFLDSNGAVKMLDQNNAAQVRFGDTVTIGLNLWDLGSASMNYMSRRDDRPGSNARARKIAVSASSAGWEQWTIVDPSNAKSTDTVSFDQTFALRSASGDYLSQHVANPYNVLETSPSLGTTEHWIIGYPVVAEAKSLRYQNAISLIRIDPGLDQRRLLWGPADINGNATVDPSGSSSATRWTICPDQGDGSGERVRFGDTIRLRTDRFKDNNTMAMASLFLSYRLDRPAPGGEAHIGVSFNAADWERWTIIDPENPASVEPVRYGDRFALHGVAGSAGYLSSHGGDAVSSATLEADHPDLPGPQTWIVGGALGADTLSPPNIPQRDGNSAGLLHISHDLARLALIKGVAMVPEVGSVAAGIIDLVWPDQGQNVWDAIKDQVKALVREMLDEQALKDFNDQLGGLKETLKQQVQASDPSIARDKLNATLVTMNTMSDIALNFTNPQQTLPYLVALATLHLTVLHDYFVNILSYYPRAEPQDIYNARNALKTMVQTYQTAAQSAKARALEWRRNLVTQSSPFYTDNRTKQVTLIADGYLQSKAGFSSPVGDAPLNDYRAHVAAIFTTQLDACLVPELLWKYLDPDSDQMPTLHSDVLITGPFGKLGEAEETGWLYGGQQFWTQPPGPGAITKLGIHAGDYVYTLQVNDTYYGSPNPSSDTITLADGQQIISASGRMGWMCHAVEFDTNIRLESGDLFSIKGGMEGGENWSAVLPDDLYPSLVALSFCMSQWLDMLYLHWRYYRWN